MGPGEVLAWADTLHACMAVAGSHAASEVHREEASPGVPRIRADGCMQAVAGCMQAVCRL